VSKLLVNCSSLAHDAGRDSFRMKFQTRLAICALLYGAALHVCARAQDSGGKTEWSQELKGDREEFAAAAKAVKQGGGHCIECYRHVNELSVKWGSYKYGEKNARDWVKAAEASGIPAEVIEAKQALGVMLLQVLADTEVKKGSKEAAEAVAIYSSLLAANANDLDALFNRGRALACLGHDDEAVADFRAYLSDDPQAPHKDLAEHFIREPKLAAHRLLPSLSIKTSTGKTFDTALFHGKVVILDFWASWCPSCRDDLPKMKTLLGPYQSRRYGILSISTDSDREKWRIAMAKEGMTWPQAIDDDGRISDLFGIRTIPHYVLLNADGLVLFEGPKLTDMVKVFVAALEQADLVAADSGQ